MARKKTKLWPFEWVMWHEFAAQHAGNPCLDRDALCALPLPLIEIIEKRMPDFWEDSEKTFERDLAATGYGGFCKGIPFFGPLVPDPESPDIDDQHLPNESHPQVAWTVKTIRKQVKDQELRSLAYAGWLVTNPEFLEERDAIRRRWEAARPEHIGFPARRLVSNQPSPTTDPKRSGAKEPEIAEIMGFYDRWSLFTLHTWDFPQPMMSISGRSDADRSGNPQRCWTACVLALVPSSR